MLANDDGRWDPSTIDPTQSVLADRVLREIRDVFPAAWKRSRKRLKEYYGRDKAIRLGLMRPRRASSAAVGQRDPDKETTA